MTGGDGSALSRAPPTTNVSSSSREMSNSTDKPLLHYAPNEPMATHVLNVLHMPLPAGESLRQGLRTPPLIKRRSTEAGRGIGQRRCTPRRTRRG